MKPEDQLKPPSDLMFTLRPSSAICEAVAALAEDVQRTRAIRDAVCASFARDFEPVMRSAETIARAALEACAGFGLAGRLADAYTGNIAGQAIAAAFRLPPPPEPLHIVLHVHVVRVAEDPSRVGVGEGEPHEWEN